MKKCIAIIIACVIVLFGLGFIINKCFQNNTSIKISSSEELSRIGVDPQYPLDGHYLLTKDLLLDSSYIPIAQTEAEPFTGILDGNNKTITTNWNNEEYSVIRYTDNAIIKSLKIYVTASELRAPLVYFAYNTLFKNIAVDGSITKQSYQIGGLVWASSGCVFENICSSVDMILTSIRFDRYNIVGGIVCQITAESESLSWANHVYANKFINCSYNGKISIDLNNATYESGSNTSFWVGNIYGATAYDSPIIYFGVLIKNCRTDGVYNITGTLDKSIVTQYNYFDHNNNSYVTYNPSSKAASSKVELDIIKFGRTHQNIHLTAKQYFYGKVSYGYYGRTGTESDAGDHLWSATYITFHGVITFLIMIIALFLLACLICKKINPCFFYNNKFFKKIKKQN